MNYNNPAPEKTDKIIIVSCRLLFALFSFFYLYCIQGNLLSQAQYVFSKGVTSYSIPIGAVLITFVLLIVQWVSNLIIRLQPRYNAVTYFPSFLMLAVLTDINWPLFDNFSWGVWAWLFPLLIVAFFVFALFLKNQPTDNIDKGDNTVARYLWPNYVVLFILMLLTGSIHPASDVYHFELKTEQLILEGKYDEALEVGERSLNTSQRLTELRAYALSQKSQLGERLFEYALEDSNVVLLKVGDTLSHYRLTYQDVCRSIGKYCGNSLPTFDSYLKVMVDSDTVGMQPLGDYLLCNYLLKKDLKKFSQKIKAYYPKANKNNIPKHFQEAALLLQMKVPADSAWQSYISEQTVRRYAEYDSTRMTQIDDVARRNILRRNFGDTYWWFYEYHK